MGFAGAQADLLLEGAVEMGVSHGHSRTTDLAFRVFGRSVHPEWLTERQFRRVGQGNWEADIRVIEGGHAIVFRSGGVCLTEVLAEQEMRLPEPGLLFHSRLKHEGTARLRPGPAVEYQSCFEVERVDPEVFAHLSDEMTLDTTRGRLLHRFRPLNRLTAAPITSLHYEARVSRLSVFSFHTFPEEWAIVRTQSLYETR